MIEAPPRGRRSPRTPAEPALNNEQTRPKRRSSFQLKLVVGALAITMLSLLISGGASYWWQQGALTTNAIERVTAVAAVQEARLQVLVDGTVDNHSLIVSRTRLRSALAEWEQSGEARLAEEIGRILVDAQNATERVVGLMVTDRSGSLVVAETGKTADPSTLPPGYVESGLGGFTTGTVLLVDSEAHLLSAGPLQVEDSVIGLLVMVESLDPLVELAGDYTGLGQTGETIVAQATGSGDAMFITPIRFDADATLKHTVRSGEDEVPITHAMAGEETVFTEATDYRGEGVIAATRYLPDAGWGIVVKMDVSEAVGPLRDFAGVALSILLIVAALAAFTAWGMSRWIARPVTRLSETASEIASGNRSVRAEVDREDELGQLAVDFNSMTSQLIAATEHLEFEVASRTEELSAKTTELQRANEALAQSNSDLQQFASVASHDLQAPLRAISSFAELLDRGYRDQLDDSAHEYIDRVLSGVKRMRELINDLLAFSRVESEARSFEPVDLNEVFDEMVDIFQHTTSDTGTRLTRGSLPTVLADKSQMSQLIQNLVGNGLKYRGPESPEIHVGAEHRGGAWQLSVADNGIGIDEKYQEQIFEIFSRLHGASDYPGTGIGLAICLRIVERHGGSIWVDSKPGRGSTFYVTIPDHV